MKSVVTNRQIFFIIIFILTGFVLINIPGNAYKASGTGAWFTIAILIIIFSVCSFLITSLNKKFQGKTIHEYSVILVGKLFGKVIGVIYAAYFMIVSIAIYQEVAQFVKSVTLNLTPISVISIIFIAATYYIAYKGITNIGRLLEIYGLIFIIVTLSVHTSQLFLGDINYIKPFFELNQVKKYIFGVKDLISPFLGIEILAVIPFGKDNKKGIFYSVMGVVYTGLFYIFIIETTVMMVGVKDIFNYEYSLVEGLRVTKLPSTILLERVDLLFLTVGMAGIICTLSLINFAVIENVSKLFTKLNKNMLFLIIGIIVFILSTFIIKHEVADFLFSNLVPIIGVFTSLIIPAILFIVAKVRKI